MLSVAVSNNLRTWAGRVTAGSSVLQGTAAGSRDSRGVPSGALVLGDDNHTHGSKAERAEVRLPGAHTAHVHTTHCTRTHTTYTHRTLHTCTLHTHTPHTAYVHTHHTPHAHALRSRVHADLGWARSPAWRPAPGNGRLPRAQDAAAPGPPVELVPPPSGALNVFKLLRLEYVSVRGK